MELSLLVGVCGGVAQPPGEDAQPIFLADVIISNSITRCTHVAGWYSHGVELRNIIPQDAGNKLQQLLSILDTEYFRNEVTTTSATLLTQFSGRARYLCQENPRM